MNLEVSGSDVVCMQEHAPEDANVLHSVKEPKRA